jgi:hypothetical protein
LLFPKVSQMIYIKIHDTDNGHMIAMCDSALIDKVLSEGDVEINIRDYSDFYKGQLVDSEKAISMLIPAKLFSANIIGKESVAAAIKGKILLKGSVKTVDKVPYANAFKIKY